MNAPNKIYINVTSLGVDYSIVPIPDFVGVEYIRKDALIKWLQEEYVVNKWFYETHAKPNELHTGRCEAYKNVISKIESL